MRCGLRRYSFLSRLNEMRFDYILLQNFLESVIVVVLGIMVNFLPFDASNCSEQPPCRSEQFGYTPRGTGILLFARAVQAFRNINKPTNAINTVGINMRENT